MSLTVWGRLSSINVQKVMWAIAEIGLPHRHVPAGGDHGGLDEPAFRALNPHGKVPVIEDDGVVVWESGAILRHLARAHAAAGLWPDDPARQAQIDAWMDWSQTTLQPALIGFFWGWYRTPPAQRDEGRNAALLAAAEAALRALDAQLSDKAYLAGDALTLADIPSGTLLYRYYEMRIARPALPNVEAWYARLGQRGGYREQVMRPFGELEGRLAF
ncbi:glutathione S-transferase family protein [Caulobacter sp. KR2-114]|uniref:glutathione S-transferase family protein n=1 Tax=Caulobacter sp. KR2-114 TaxID=3400912 RepID=UPI003C0B29B2